MVSLRVRERRGPAEKRGSPVMKLSNRDCCLFDARERLM